MTSMDKAGIAIAIAITAVAVGFTATGGVGITNQVTQEAEKTSKIGELQREVEVVKQVTEDVKQAAQEARESTEKAKTLTEDVISAKLPAKLVSIPAGTAVPGCEKVNLCYDPPNVTIFIDGEIIWRNDDSSAHTVTSGTAITGPDGNFDSGLIMAEETFSVRFEEKGEFRYFCMIHPWAEGLVTVE